MPNAPILTTEERLARRHRRMQLGLALEEERRVERLASRVSFEEIESDPHWPLWIAGASVVACLAWFGGQWVERSSRPPANAVPAPRIAQAAVPAPAPAPPRFSGPIIRGGPIYQAPASVAPELPGSFAPPEVAVAPNSVPAVDYAARDRRIVGLKQESVALDDFARNIRSNPGVSHHAEPGHYVYEAWRYQRNGWTNSEALNAYLKWLDQRRDEVRREKWRLEGR